MIAFISSKCWRGHKSNYLLPWLFTLESAAISYSSMRTIGVPVHLSLLLINYVNKQRPQGGPPKLVCVNTCVLNDPPLPQHSCDSAPLTGWRSAWVEQSCDCRPDGATILGAGLNFGMNLAHYLHSNKTHCLWLTSSETPGYSSHPYPVSWG